MFQELEPKVQVATRLSPMAIMQNRKSLRKGHMFTDVSVLRVFEGAWDVQAMASIPGVGGRYRRRRKKEDKLFR